MRSGLFLGFSRAIPPLVSTSFQLDVLKLIALIAMCLDHLNTALGWKSAELWMVGRMAFPLFALVWGYNVARRPISQASLNRLWLWAVVAQPAYWLALKGQGVIFFDLNILFAFVVSGQLIRAWQVRREWAVLSALVGLAVYLPLSSMSYGLVGVVMLLASVGLFHFKQLERQWMMRGLWMVSVLVLNLSVELIYALAGLLLSLMVWFAVMQTKTVQVDQFMPRHFFPLAYTGHLLLIGGKVWAVSIID